MDGDSYPLFYDQLKDRSAPIPTQVPAFFIHCIDGRTGGWVSNRVTDNVAVIVLPLRLWARFSGNLQQRIRHCGTTNGPRPSGPGI